MMQFRFIKVLCESYCFWNQINARTQNLTIKLEKKTKFRELKPLRSYNYYYAL